MRVSIISTHLLVTTSVLAAAQGPTGGSHLDLTEARRLIRDNMAKDSVPGLAIAVLRRDTILWEAGFGWADREARVAVTANTPFPLASLTKTVVATAVMALHEQGRLDLDRPANDHIDTSRLWSPRWDPGGATVRRLMTHTSGLSTFDVACAAEQPQCRLPSADETIRRYGVLVWPPGEHFDYSNLGYYVLGELVARAVRRDLGAILRDEVFRPLGMTHSSLGVDPSLVRQTAVAYSWSRGALPHETLTVSAPTLRFSGASAAYASAHDLVLFGAFHMKARRPGQRAILSDAAVDSMQYSVVPAGASRGYGLGWWVDEDRFGYRSVLAQGGNDATSAWLRLIPSERVAVAVVANKGVGFPGDVVDAVLAALLPRYAEGLTAQRVRSAQAANSGPTPTAATTMLDSAFVGSWTGVVRTADGEVPLMLVLTDSGETRGTIGSRAALGRARFATGLLRLTIPGDLEAADSGSSSRRLAFYLAPRGRTVNGTVTTNPNRGSGLDGRVSYWVELIRQR